MTVGWISRKHLGSGRGRTFFLTSLLIELIDTRQLYCLRARSRGPNPKMRHARVLKGWRLWVTVTLFGYGLFLVILSLAKISSHFGSRWNISWTAVLLQASGLTLVVSLLTFLDPRTKH